jgi:hypothetical protein
VAFKLNLFREKNGIIRINGIIRMRMFENVVLTTKSGLKRDGKCVVGRFVNCTPH